MSGTHHAARASWALVLVLGLIGTGCPDDPTQVMVVVQADPAVAAAGGRLRIEAYGGETLDALSSVAIEDVVANYPYVLAIAPQNDDTSRAWRVVVRLEGAALEVESSASGVFSPGDVKRLDVLLEARCASVACSSGMTCRAGSCVSETVDTGSLPDFDGLGPGIVDAGPADDVGAVDSGSDGGSPGDGGPQDAGPEDAGPVDGGPIDGGPTDAGTDAPPTDAGPCGEACFNSTPCFDGTLVCGEELMCEEMRTPRTEGACGVRGTCIMDGYCAIDPVATTRRPAGFPEGEQFAEAIDLSGSRLIAGSHRPTVMGIANAGRVFIYRTAPDAWALETELPRPTPTPAVDDAFGRGVSIDGDLAVATYQSGFAVYERDADSGWEFVETIDGGLEPLDGPIELDGDRVVAAGDDGLRIWEREGGAFVEKTVDARSCSLLEDVAISGDLIAIGCFDDSVQIYARTGAGSWTFRTTVDGGWLDFGISVDIEEGSPSRLLVGALGFLSGTRTDGRAFLYEMGASPASWNLRAAVQPFDQIIDEGIRFGLDVELLDGGRFVASAPLAFWGSGAGAPDPGIVYLFGPRDRLGRYVETARFTATLRVSGERFGDGLAADGNQLAVSSNDFMADEPNGAFYVFDVTP